MASTWFLPHASIALQNVATDAVLIADYLRCLHPGPKVHRSSTDREARWSLQFGTGSGHFGAHWWQLPTGSYHTVQRDATPWVCTHTVILAVENVWLCSFSVCVAELVTKLYEAAVKKVPLSEEYHSHLFMAYARVGEYKKMQQVSLIFVHKHIFNTLN